MKIKSQYPSDYNPPNHGKCEECGYKTKGWTTHWLALCPMHWQVLYMRVRGGD